VVKRQDITALLLAWSGGDEAARGPLFEGVYAGLRRTARRHLGRERANHSLSPTALVHEAYLKLIDQRRTGWQNRAHFFSVAARLMRRILVDCARARAAGKRRPAATVMLEEADPAMAPLNLDVLAPGEALDRLARASARQRDLVELRFFAGLTVEDTASVLNVAPITVKRDWALARAFLFRELRHHGS
jgi:RNA polymerase sigma-70 factor, ECF subfamily